MNKIADTVKGALKAITGKKEDDKGNDYIKAVVIGAKGEVGSVLYKMLKGANFQAMGVDIGPQGKPGYTMTDPVAFKGCDFMHVCIPYVNQDQFAGAVGAYVKEFVPQVVIVHSTVIPGTTQHLIKQKFRTDANLPSGGYPTCSFAYSPCRGQHSDLEKDFKRYSKWVVCEDSMRDSCESHLRDMGFRVEGQAAGKNAQGMAHLELIKLLDTSQYGVLIMYAQIANRMSKMVGLPYDLARLFMAETQELYGLRPDIRPGYVGGKCVHQNIDLLNRVFPHKLWKEFVESNKLALKEFGDDE